MVVSRPQEFPLTRENVILIRSFIFFLCHCNACGRKWNYIMHCIVWFCCLWILSGLEMRISLPCSQQLVETFIKVSFVSQDICWFPLFLRRYLVISFLSQEISADQSIVSVSPEDRRCLFPKVQTHTQLRLRVCRCLSRRGIWSVMTTTPGEGEVFQLIQSVVSRVVNQT